MTTKTELQNKIQELEAELVELKSQLSSYENTIENASVKAELVPTLEREGEREREEVMRRLLGVSKLEDLEV